MSYGASRTDALRLSGVYTGREKEETPDGFRVDADGNLWCGWRMSPALDGVKVFNPAGKAIGFIALPERAANVCFGGRYRNRLFIAASHSIYSLYVNTQGVAGGWVHLACREQSLPHYPIGGPRQQTTELFPSFCRSGR